MFWSTTLFRFSCSILFLVSKLENFVMCNFCSEDIQLPPGGELRFTKELSHNEYGIGKHSKSLHCCAANYKSILWVKDHKLYPWREGESNFVLDLNSRNQTLHVKALSKHDSGTYSCYIVSGDSYHTRHIPLTVFEIDFTGIPKKTFTPPARVPVDLDETARLYCETFVGPLRPSQGQTGKTIGIDLMMNFLRSASSALNRWSHFHSRKYNFLPAPSFLMTVNPVLPSVNCKCKIDLPDARSKISWFKLGVNNTRTLLPNVNNTRARVKKIIRDEGQTLGMFLIIDHVQSSDYGDYLCSVSNTDDQIVEMQSELVHADYLFDFSRSHLHLMALYASCVLMLILVTFYIVYFRFRYDIRLCIRQYTTSEKNDTNTEYDVCILYEPKEENFITGVLTPRLTNQYEYSVISSHVLDSRSVISMECQSRLAVCRSVLAVISTKELENKQNQICFSQKLYSISRIHTRVICLLIQESPDSLSPKSLKMITSMSHVKFLTWPLYKKDWHKMWQTLRLNLPIKRQSVLEPNSGNYSTVDDRHIAVCSV